MVMVLNVSVCDYACYYNRCHGNAVEEISELRDMLVTFVCVCHA
jgi:hypothetical protein